jgi:hypothetical protein
MKNGCGFSTKFLITFLLLLGFAAKGQAALEAVDPDTIAQLSEVAPDTIEKNPNAHVHHRLAVPISDQFFSKLWDAYPEGEADFVKSEIGGSVNAAWVENTCPIRLSRSLNYSGHPVLANPHLLTLRGADKKQYAFRLSEFMGYLKQSFGHPTISVTRTPGDDGTLLEESIRGHKGIVVFIVKGWVDATGHVDLWDGESVKHEAHFDRASAVYLWE